MEDSDAIGEWSWDRLARISSVGPRVHARIRMEAESLCQELAVPWSDRWCDDAVTFVERRAADAFASTAAAKDHPSYLRFVCYVGEGAVRCGAGWWVELLGVHRVTARLAVYVPAENSLVAVESLIVAALEHRTGRAWLDRYSEILSSRGRVLSGTGIRDERVVAINAAVEEHLEAAVSEAGSTDGAREQARHVRVVLGMHQPGGGFGAECMGCRGGFQSGSVWPCDTVKRLLTTEITSRPRGRCGTGRPNPGFRGRPGRDVR